MSDFTTIFNNIEVASSVLDVMKTDQYQNINGTDFLAKLKKSSLGAKEGSHFLRTTLKVHGNGECLSRKDSNTTSSANFIVIDCDKRIDKTGKEIEGAPDPKLVSSILIEYNISHVVYGSYSHYIGDKGNRYRIIIPTSKAYSRDQLSSTVESMITLVNIHLDDVLLANAKENSTWSQPWYYPRKSETALVNDLYLEYLDGELFNVVEPAIIPSLNIIPRLEEVSPIDAFNEQNRISDLLCRYGYKRLYSSNDYEKWLSPESTSGKPGITVKGNKFFSHHNDVFNDGFWHDAFDLMRFSEGLSEVDAIKWASQNTITIAGCTVDEHNKKLRNKAKEHTQKY